MSKKIISDRNPRDRTRILRSIANLAFITLTLLTAEAIAQADESENQILGVEVESSPSPQRIFLPVPPPVPPVEQATPEKKKLRIRCPLSDDPVNDTGDTGSAYMHCTVVGGVGGGYLIESVQGGGRNSVGFLVPAGRLILTYGGFVSIPFAPSLFLETEFAVGVTPDKSSMSQGSLKVASAVSPLFIGGYVEISKEKIRGYQESQMKAGWTLMNLQLPVPIRKFKEGENESSDYAVINFLFVLGAGLSPGEGNATSESLQVGKNELQDFGKILLNIRYRNSLLTAGLEQEHFYSKSDEKKRAEVSTGNISISLPTGWLHRNETIKLYVKDKHVRYSNQSGASLQPVHHVRGFTESGVIYELLF